MEKIQTGTGKKLKSVSYAKWGYIFIAPFFIAFLIFRNGESKMKAIGHTHWLNSPSSRIT